MDPDRINARLAPRSSWRAVDFGTRFYRRWWRQAALAWLLFTAVPFALLAGYATATRQLWPLLLFWWLKPLWERPLLALYGRALFSDPPDPITLLREFPRYGLNGLAAQLTWRRLSPLRGFLTGVWQLEGAQGSKVSGRISVLLRPPGQRAGTLTLTVLALEHVLTVALLVLVMTLVPWKLNLEWSVWLQEQSHPRWLLTTLAWYLVLMVTEPLYVATSFALYLNQRTWLEGWDLQPGLARIGERRRRARRMGGALALLMVALAAAPQPVEARDAARANTPDPKQDALNLLASDTFMPFEERQERRLRESLRDDDNDSWWQALLRYLLERDTGERDPLSVPDALVSGLGYLLLALLVVLIVIVVRKRLPGGATRQRRDIPAMPVRVTGLHGDAGDHLPVDLERACEQQLARGDARAALALLLCDGLGRLFRHHPLPLTAGATEQDCLHAYRRALGDTEVVAWLARLIEAWTHTAWAHRPGDHQHVRALMRQWLVLRPALTGGTP